MNTEIISLIAGFVIAPLFQVIKGYIKLDRTQSYSVVFLMCLFFSLGFELVQNDFNLDTLLANFSLVVSTSQIAYGLVIKNLESTKKK